MPNDQITGKSATKRTELLTLCLEEWGIKSLTDIQELAIAAGVPLGSSAIVCAPTSSGKTLIGELALANVLSDGFDALYLVSHKALAEQKILRLFRSILESKMELGCDCRHQHRGS